jgi:hypothetical protein
MPPSLFGLGFSVDGRTNALREKGTDTYSAVSQPLRLISILFYTPGFDTKTPHAPNPLSSSLTRSRMPPSLFGLGFSLVVAVRGMAMVCVRGMGTVFVVGGSMAKRLCSSFLTVYSCIYVLNPLMFFIEQCNLLLNERWSTAMVDSDGRQLDSRQSDGRRSTVGQSDSRRSDSRTVDGRTVGQSDSRRSDSRTVGQSDSRQSDGRQSDGRQSDSPTADGPTEPLRVSTGRRSTLDTKA